MSSGKSRRYAFVLPRFGEGIIGGAETLAGRLAEKVAAQGDQVEVFTTCARDNRTWENVYPAGQGREFGLPVHRFPVDPRNLEAWIPKQIRVAEGMRLSVDDQLDWLSEGVNSSQLYEALAARAETYDALFFAPYLFATTFWGSLISPHRSYLIPCLHDECYAYLEVIASMMTQVRGALFNCLPEMRLARSLYGEIEGGEVGMGFDPIAERDVNEIRPYFDEQFPYLVYLGRKETGKNVQVLIDNFIGLKEQREEVSEFKLVIVGGGDFSDLGRDHAKERDDIIDLRHLSEDEKRSILKHALALVQPSRNESFSIVIMEAWQLGVPVIVDGECAVTRYHVEESGGGLYYTSLMEFVEVVSLFASNQALRTRMAAHGADYVAEKYSWDAVLERFHAVMGRFLNGN